MPDAVHGQALFKGLTEYPLPQVSGVRDYVFYFVPNTGYGESARIFFKKYYPHHVSQEAASLEQLISALYKDVTSGGVTQIRELVIVSHGTSNGLLIPLVAAPSDPNLNFTTAYSLMLLQKQIQGDPTSSLAQQRAAVIAHMHADSWVTLRACNFGQTSQGMYALYSFFGGNPNVYAPMLYQFFGHQPIEDGMRYPTRLMVHEHLVKQRLQPKDVHTPDRQDAIVRALVDPASFSSPFTIATTSLSQAESPGYTAIVDALNAGHGTPALQAAFASGGFPLSDPRYSVVEADASWRINDTLAHPDAQTTFPVQYRVDVTADLAASTATLSAQAQLIAVHSAYEQVPIQLFLAPGEHDAFIGMLFSLAHSADDDAPDAVTKTTYTDVLAALSAGSFTSGSADLRSLFEQEGRALADTATISQTSSTTPPPDTLPRITWTVGPDAGGQTYLVKLEHPFSSDDVRGHTINVFSNLDAAARLQDQMQLLSYLGTDPDCPGVELAAFMDRLSTDDLVDLVTFLRAPYRPENVIYLWHAQQAIIRKGSYIQWEMARFPGAMNTVLLPDGDPLISLSYSETADKNAAAYPFTFEGNWAEVKASNRTPTAFTADLFLEESLPKRFGIDPAVIGTADPSVLDENSPYTSASELRALESLGFNQFFTSDDKDTSRPPVLAPSATSCADFRAALALMSTSSNASIDQVAAQLAGQKTADGTSYLSIILGLKKKYSFLRNMTKLTELNTYLKLPKIPVPTDYYEGAKLAAKVIAKATAWEAASVIIKDLGEWDMVVTIPFKMWLHILDEQVAGIKQAEASGRLTAIRRWLRFLVEQTFATDPQLTDNLTIDVTVSRTGKAYYLEAYDEEMNEGEGMHGPTPARFILYDEDFKAGFDGGAAAAAGLWPVILTATKQVMSDFWLGENLDSCHVQALIDAGFLDIDALRASIVRAFAERLLNEIPHV
jgi:hypothetical protein